MRDDIERTAADEIIREIDRMSRAAFLREHFADLLGVTTRRTQAMCPACVHPPHHGQCALPVPVEMISDQVMLAPCDCEALPRGRDK